MASSVAFASSLSICLLHSSWGFNNLAPLPLTTHHARSNSRLSLHIMEKEDEQAFLDNNSNINQNTRRNFFASMASSTLMATLISASVPVMPARAEGTKSTADANITDEIFIEFKGLSNPGDGSSSSGNSNDRITIGLFGNDAPQPVSILKQVVTKEGYKSKCKPLDTSRTLQKEQLEANKVYNSCLDTEDSVGVNYDYSSVWRVIKDERVDVGAVSGKYIARESPTFEDAQSGLTHDAAGVVSVRRGNDGGYGFTIFPGTGDASTLDEDNIVVGRVIEGMDVVDRLNALPAVKSAGLKLTGGSQDKKYAPSRGCRYGGSEYYCSENKPLKKVLLDKTGVL
mmetsp:Transcript_13528/g.29410  ORF Transcript_13528/g.29410 Transcript_13528/m.29410 type:complete len:341 (-) Transcript_13528:200-1222(-)